MRSLNIINRFTDIVFPRRCPVCGRPVEMGKGLIHPECEGRLKAARGAVCEKCGKILSSGISGLCTSCEGNDRTFERGRSLYLHDSNLSSSIYSFKYRGRREYAQFYARKMADEYADLLMEWNITAIVPVPVHYRRLKERGYNQAELIAELLSEYTGIPCCPDRLIRFRSTLRQKNLTRHARTFNTAGVFRCPCDVVIRGNILLVDDIMTTGNTINNCAGALLEAGALRVFFLTVSTGEE